MSIVIDNCILVRVADQDDTLHAKAVQSLKVLEGKREPLILIPQAVREFWVVATRPKENNGLGLMPQDAQQIVAGFERFLTFMADSPDVYQIWKALVADYKVAGKNAHDAGYVAAMKAHGIRQILTFDVRDFARYRDDVRVLTPDEIIIAG